MKKRIISIALRTFISVGLIVLLLYIMRGKYDEIWSAIKGSQPLLLILAIAAFVLAMGFASFRMVLIINAQSGTTVTFAEAFSLTFIGYFFNNFLPTSIGGDVAKAYYLSKKSAEKLGSFTSIFIDRVIGLITMIFMAAAALLFVKNQFIDVNVKCMIYAITLCSLLAIVFSMNKNFAKKFSVLLFFIKPMEDKLRRIYNAIHSYKKHSGMLWKALIISVVSQALFFVSIGVIAASIGAIIPPLDILLRMPIICAISLLPSINGLGVREGSTVMLLGPVIGKESAFAVGILWFMMLLVVSVAGGLIYAFSPQFKMKWGDIEKIEKEDEEVEAA
ncbi:MAG: lysylphosphatidylglycerol synthase transmembrane domain-containing protein [Candidatus Omnitrophica bacterium]|nr:lysylphosphatidylglycerol synthase transmembrane domain-containing protein [Candidatus Omnitrophota bacterium]